MRPVQANFFSNSSTWILLLFEERCLDRFLVHLVIVVVVVILRRSPSLCVFLCLSVCVVVQWLFVRLSVCFLINVHKETFVERWKRREKSENNTFFPSSNKQHKQINNNNEEEEKKPQAIVEDRIRRAFILCMNALFWVFNINVCACTCPHVYDGQKTLLYAFICCCCVQRFPMNSPDFTFFPVQIYTHTKYNVFGVETRFRYNTPNYNNEKKEKQSIYFSILILSLDFDQTKIDSRGNEYNKSVEKNHFCAHSEW